MLAITGLLILWLVPFVVHQLAKRACSSRTWAVTGLSFGMIIAPASLGLYSLFFVPYIGLLPGMLGLISAFVHGVPGFEAATALGLRDPHTIVNARESLTIEVINGLFWGIIYGALGHLIDRWRGSGAAGTEQGQPRH